MGLLSDRDMVMHSTSGEGLCGAEWVEAGNISAKAPCCGDEGSPIEMACLCMGSPSGELVVARWSGLGVRAISGVGAGRGLNVVWCQSGTLSGLCKLLRMLLPLKPDLGVEPSKMGESTGPVGQHY